MAKTRKTTPPKPKTPSLTTILNFFKKSVEMLAESNKSIQRCGLCNLGELIEKTSSPMVICCVEAIADWLRVKGNDAELVRIAWLILQRGIGKVSPNDIANHKRKCGMPLWPDLYDTNLENISLNSINLQSANLQGANLQGTIFENVNLDKVNLKDACIYPDTDMTKAHGLTIEQILEAKWCGSKGKGAYPKFPKYILEDTADNVTELQNWYGALSRHSY